jgi:hypothetical protein
LDCLMRDVHDAGHVTTFYVSDDVEGLCACARVDSRRST